jgi:hypothetical protein
MTIKTRKVKQKPKKRKIKTITAGQEVILLKGAYKGRRAKIVSVYLDSNTVRLKLLDMTVLVPITYNINNLRPVPPKKPKSKKEMNKKERIEDILERIQTGEIKRENALKLLKKLRKKLGTMEKTPWVRIFMVAIEEILKTFPKEEEKEDEELEDDLIELLEIPPERVKRKRKIIREQIKREGKRPIRITRIVPVEVKKVQKTKIRHKKRKTKKEKIQTRKIIQKKLKKIVITRKKRKLKKADVIKESGEVAEESIPKEDPQKNKKEAEIEQIVKEKIETEEERAKRKEEECNNFMGEIDDFLSLDEKEKPEEKEEEIAEKIISFDEKQTEEREQEKKDTKEYLEKVEDILTGFRTKEEDDEFLKEVERTHEEIFGEKMP